MPAHPIEDVRRLAAAGTFRLSIARARDPLVAKFGSFPAARAFAKKALSALTESDFSETVVQRFDLKLDVYGRIENGVLWYIKLAIEIDGTGEEIVLVLSFHPAERPIRTRGGELKP